MRATAKKTKPAAKVGAGMVKKKPATAKKQTKKRVTPKRYSVPFEEMCRLMKVYGSTKCLRKRGSSVDGSGAAAGGCTKIESVKRKFYRWFPDLEERFVKDEAGGYYVPKFGHEFEMRYRQEMRRKDGESLNRKRTSGRRRHQQQEGTSANIMRAASSVVPSTAPGAAVSTTQAFTSSILAGATFDVSHPMTPPSIVTPQSSFSERDEIKVKDKLEFDRELLATATAAASAVAKRDYKHDPSMAASGPGAANAIIEPLDRFFDTERNMFEEVDENFFDPDYCANLPDIVQPSSSSCSSGSEEHLGPWSIESSRGSDDLDGITHDVKLDNSYVG